MVICHKCLKNLGVLNSKYKWEKDGQIYCAECSKQVLEDDKNAQMGDTYLCTFQEPIFIENEFKGYNCFLTHTARSFARGAIPETRHEFKECEPDRCPMLQTWMSNKRIEKRLG